MYVYVYTCIHMSGRKNFLKIKIPRAQWHLTYNLSKSSVKLDIAVAREDAYVTLLSTRRDAPLDPSRDFYLPACIRYIPRYMLRRHIYPPFSPLSQNRNRTERNKVHRGRLLPHAHTYNRFSQWSFIRLSLSRSLNGGIMSANKNNIYRNVSIVLRKMQG